MRNPFQRLHFVPKCIMKVKGRRITTSKSIMSRLGLNSRRTKLLLTPGNPVSLVIARARDGSSYRIQILLHDKTKTSTVRVCDPMTKDSRSINGKPARKIQSTGLLTILPAFEFPPPPPCSRLLRLKLPTIQQFQLLLAIKNFDRYRT